MTTTITHPNLTGRLARAYRWIPAASSSLLDAGCSYGYGTFHYRRRVRECKGVDIDLEALSQARTNNPGIDFRHASLEALPFTDATFDTVICTDVLEHVTDEIVVLNELYRVLKPGGTLVLTTPHRGLVTMLDPFNYTFYLRRHALPLYRALYRLLTGRPATKVAPPPRHRHYTLGDLRRLLQTSAFAGHSTIVAVARTGLLVDVLATNVRFLAQTLARSRFVDRLAAVFMRAAAVDDRVHYGIAANNIGIRVTKL